MLKYLTVLHCRYNQPKNRNLTMKSNIRLFNTEKEAQAFIDKNFDVGVPYEFSLRDGSILWAICFPDSEFPEDHDYATFLDEDGDYVSLNDVEFEEKEIE